MKGEIDWPSVSFIVCTYNCKDYAKKCFELIKNQNYPKEKIEMIAVDSYSTDGTIEALKELGAKILFIKARPERGAKKFGYEKSKGEIIIFLDSDNMIVERDWIKKMVYPLITDKKVGFCISRMAVLKSDSFLNRYLNLIGPDPFVSYCSMDALLSFEKINLMDKGDYYTYKITPENFLITGGNYFTIRRETLKKIGGYMQDIDVVYKLAQKNLANVGIPKNAHLHHLIARNINDFLGKKVRWAKIFFEEQINNREFNWIPLDLKGKLKLFLRIAANLSFFPSLFPALKMAVKKKEIAWLLHPLMVWLTTSSYIYSFVLYKILKYK